MKNIFKLMLLLKISFMPAHGAEQVLFNDSRVSQTEIICRQRDYMTTTRDDSMSSSFRNNSDLYATSFRLQENFVRERENADELIRRLRPLTLDLTQALTVSSVETITDASFGSGESLPRRRIFDFNQSLTVPSIETITHASFGSGGSPPRRRIFDFKKDLLSLTGDSYGRVGDAEYSILKIRRILDFEIYSFDGDYLSRSTRKFIENLFRAEYFHNRISLISSSPFNNLINLVRNSNATDDDHSISIHQGEVEPRNAEHIVAQEALTIVAQEALTYEREQITQGYIKMATQGRSSDAITKLLSPPDAVDKDFERCFEDLDRLLSIFLDHHNMSETTKFIANNAIRTLRLIGGDQSIEHHRISQTNQYSSFSYPGLPNIRQLLILAWRLSKVDKKDFVESIIAEHCRAPSKWRQWSKPFVYSVFKDIVSLEDFGQVLNADRERGSPFIMSIVKVLEGSDFLPILGSNKIIMSLGKGLLKKQSEKIMPVVEALFMVMRGHNNENELLNAEEPNKPACAEGAYLGLLKSIAEIVSEDMFFIPEILIKNC